MSETPTEDEIEVGARIKWTVTNGLMGKTDTFEGEIVEVKTETNHHAGKPDTETEVAVIDLEDGGTKELAVYILVQEKDGDFGDRTIEDFQPAPSDDEGDEDDDEPEVVTDGGRDTTVHVSDEDIEAAIKQHDDPDHPDATTVAEVREVLAELHARVTDTWDEFEDLIDDDGPVRIVAETDAVIVLGDGDGHLLGDDLNMMDVDDDILRRVVSTVMHAVAKQHCGYDWSASSPFVVAKPPAWTAGSTHTIREIARHARSLEGGRTAAALDQLAVEEMGYPQSVWARLTGRNPSSVSRSLSRE